MIDDAYALKLAREAYDGSTTYFDTNIRNGLEKDLRQFQGKHSSDSKYMSDAYRSRSRLFRPKTRGALRKNEAIAAEAFFSTLDNVSITTDNEKDKRKLATADVMQSLVEYRLQKTIPWFQLVCGGYQDAMVSGIVCSYQDWRFDPIKGIDQPSIELVPIENIRFDPAASWLDPVNTSPYFIRLIPMYIKDVKARMKPMVEGVDPKWTPMTDAQLKSALKPYDSTRMLREDQRTDPRDIAQTISDFTIVWVHQNIIEIDSVDLIYYTLGTQFLLSKPVPLKTKFAHGKRPFVIGISMIETHKTYPAGPVRISRDVQAEINEVTNQRIDNVKFVMNKRYFVKRNKQVDLRSLTRNSPGSVSLMSDPEGDVKVVETQDVTSSSFQEHDRLNLDFDDLTGSFSQASISSNRKLNETVGGLNLLTNDANQLTRYQLKTFVETWVIPVLRQLMLLEHHYETDEVILALAAEKAQLFMKFGESAQIDDFLSSELGLTVNVGMGATNPADKINNLLKGITGVKDALADGVLEQHGVNTVEIIKEVFGALGHRDGGRFITAEEDQDPRVTALQQQLESVTQQLEAKFPPELVKAQIDEIRARIRNMEADKVKKGVESSYAAMQAAEVIASVPAVAPVADMVMKVAGYVPPIPEGIDPNFPQAQAPVSGPAAIAQAVGAVGQVMPGQPGGNTDPMGPANAPSPNVGAMHGIETQRADGVQ